MTGTIIGGQIRKFRTERGITQENLAGILHIGHQTISKWETGQLLPDVEMLITLSTFFGVSLDELCGQNLKLAEEIPGQFPIDPLHDSHSFPSLWESYQEFRRVSQPWAQTDPILSHELDYLRNIHDTVRCDREKEQVNECIHACGLKILDFSRDDRLRSRACFQLALVSAERGEYALAREYCDRVLFADMSPSVYLSLGFPHGSAEWVSAQQQTIARSVSVLRNVLTNLGRHYRRSGDSAGEERCRILLDRLKDMN